MRRTRSELVSCAAAAAGCMHAIAAAVDWLNRIECCAQYTQAALAISSLFLLSFARLAKLFLASMCL